MKKEKKNKRKETKEKKKVIYLKKELTVK